MASRVKEQEKNEKIIRSLTKLPENRKCINCGSLGPQYVCTNFSVFVCTTCSGIHREFTHRVKSISMATFTPAEVAALQAGGNQRARECYLKEWDSTRQSLPDTSNPDKLRDFIRAVYVEKRFSGDRRGRLSDGDDPYDSRKQPDRSKYGQSPSYDDRSDDRRYSNRPGSRGSDRGFDEKMSPARFDDRDRYDRSYQNDRDRDRRYDDRDRRFDDRERRYDERDRQYDDRDGMRRYDDRDRRYDRRYDERDRRYDERDRRYDERDRYEDQRRGDENRRSSEDLDRRFNRPPSYKGGETPPLRSVRDILGDDVPKLRVEDGTRTNGRAEDAESPQSASSQPSEGRSRSFKSLDAMGNGNAKATVPQPVISESLIDFTADSEPPKATTTSASAFDPFAEPPKANTAFDPFATGTVTAEPPKANVPFDPFATAEPPKLNVNTPFDPFATPDQPTLVTSSDAGWASFDLSPPKVAPAPTTAPAPTDFFQQPVVDVSTQGKPSAGWTNGQPNGLQPVQSLQPPAHQSLHPVQSFHAPQVPSSQPSQSLQPLPSMQQGTWSAPLQQHQQHQAQPAQGTTGLQPQRRAIPEDLFFSPPMPPMNVGGMHPHMRFPQGPQPQLPPYHFGAGMQGPVPYPQQPTITKSNPFDIPGDSNQNFPSMAPLQSALPGFNQGPVPGAPPTQWQLPGAPPTFMQGGGFGQQQIPVHMMPPPPQQGGFGNPQGFMNGAMPFPVQPAAGGGGNPFG